MKKSIKYLLSITAILMLAACVKEADNEDIGCDPVISTAGFLLVDKTSGADLFSGGTPRYKRSDLKIYHFNYKNETDTLPLRSVTSDIGQAFVFEIEPAKTKDTVLLKIADSQMDTLIFTVKKTSNPCLRSTIEQIHFNGNPVIQDSNFLILKR